MKTKTAKPSSWSAKKL